MYALDAFSGEILQQVTTGVPEGGQALEACLTADGKYVLSGCGDRHIRAWSVETGNVVAEWKEHADIPTCLKFSPKKMLVASACRALALWIPDVSANAMQDQRPASAPGATMQWQQQQQQVAF